MRLHYLAGAADLDRFKGHGEVDTAWKAYGEKMFPVCLVGKAISVELEHTQATQKDPQDARANV